MRNESIPRWLHRRRPFRFRLPPMRQRALVRVWVPARAVLAEGPPSRVLGPAFGVSAVQVRRWRCRIQGRYMGHARFRSVVAWADAWLADPDAEGLHAPGRWSAAGYEADWCGVVGWLVGSGLSKVELGRRLGYERPGGGSTSWRRGGGMA